MSLENQICYSPDEERKINSNLWKYQSWLEKNYKVSLSENYNLLHHWSVQNPHLFWKSLIEFFSVDYSGKLDPSFKQLSFYDYPWFPNLKLNFSKNLLKYVKESPRSVALNFIHESGLKQKISYQQLVNSVYALQKFLKKVLKKGDVVAAYMPNSTQTVVGMLATSSLGNIFTSTSCDFGIQGVVDRFSQSRPKVLIMAAGYEYNGKYFDLTSKVRELKEALPSIEKVIIVDVLNKNLNLDKFSNAKFVSIWSEIVDENLHCEFSQLEFVENNFSDPLYIMYSSGTTGKPKCIIHSVGGTLLQHLKELSLHTNVSAHKKIFYFTTCGWMMWNWLVSSLALGAEIYLYEGSPTHPTINAYMDILAEEKIEIWGTSPKFLRALETSGWVNKHNYEKLELILSTGSPLLAEQYDYVYKNIASNIQLSSISGGTDIISCFMLGHPYKPVKRGLIQCIGLGMNVVSLDAEGNEVFSQEGELVCKTPFISQPIGFLNDCNDEKFKEAYFSKFENIWYHGDYIIIDKDGCVKVLGRSDATLNPGGVRIGTGEIYRQTEKLSWIEDSICVSKNDGKGDVDIVLFVKPRLKNFSLNQEAIKEVKSVIRSNTTPRHVPKWVLQVQDIPYTRSGKKMEMTINKLLNGRDIGSKEAISNPECIDEYVKILNSGVFNSNG